MTTKQIQCLLTYLGYDPGVIDGIDGKKTQAALASFRADYGVGAEGLVGAVAGTVAKLEKPKADNAGASSGAEQYLKADGYYHIPRGVNVQLSRNLWSQEVMCQGSGCCAESIISKRMVDTFQAIRDEFGDAISIATSGGSGFRCAKHNAAVGGAGGSLHLTGSAFDLHCRDKSKLMTVVRKHITDGEIGVYSWGIHAGVWSRGFVNRFSGK